MLLGVGQGRGDGVPSICIVKAPNTVSASLANGMHLSAMHSKHVAVVLPDIWQRLAEHPCPHLIVKHGQVCEVLVQVTNSVILRSTHAHAQHCIVQQCTMQQCTTPGGSTGASGCGMVLPGGWEPVS